MPGQCPFAFPVPVAHMAVAEGTAALRLVHMQPGPPFYALLMTAVQVKLSLRQSASSPLDRRKAALTVCGPPPTRC